MVTYLLKRQSFHTAYIFESEVEALASEIARYPRLETRGGLYGLQRADGSAVIFLITGPGPNALHSTAVCEQDERHHLEVSQTLFDRYFLQMLGEWHSHHHLGFNTPSAVDVQTAKQSLHESGWARFAVWISKHNVLQKEEVTDIRVRANLFSANGRHGESSVAILPSKSPVRQAVSTLYNSFATEGDKAVPILQFETQVPTLHRGQRYTTAQLSPANAVKGKPQGVAHAANTIYLLGSTLQELTSVSKERNAGTLHGLYTHFNAPVVWSCKEENALLDPIGTWTYGEIARGVSQSAGKEPVWLLLAEHEGKLRLWGARCRNGAWSPCWIVINDEESQSLPIDIPYMLTPAQLRYAEQTGVMPEEELLLQRITPYTRSALISGKARAYLSQDGKVHIVFDETLARNIVVRAEFSLRLLEQNITLIDIACKADNRPLLSVVLYARSDDLTSDCERVACLFKEEVT